MVNYLVDRLMEKGLSVRVHNMVDVDTGEFAKSVVDVSTVVFASPTVLAGPHPSIASAAYLMNVLKPKAKFVAVIGSFGWGGNIAARIKDLLPNLSKQLSYFDAVLIKGLPKEDDLKALDRLAEEIYSANNPA
jgi:flavorubredoxin